MLSSADRPSTYRHVPGFPGYGVTDTGAISGPRRDRLRQRANASGHLYVLVGPRAARAGGRRKLFVHRAVLLAFVGPCPAGQEARHANDNPADNRLANLSWGTRLANQADRVRNGRRSRGSAAPGAQLSADQVTLIRTDRRSTRELGAELGVSHTTIRAARSGRRYR